MILSSRLGASIVDGPFAVLRGDVVELREYS